MNKKIILYIVLLFIFISCNRTSYDTKFIIHNNSDIKYDSILISDKNGNEIKDFNFDIGKERKLLLKYDLNKSKGYIEGDFIIELYKDNKRIKLVNFGYWGLGSFYSTYKILITNDSIFSKEISTSIY